jgi:hypothetical protein
MTSPEPGPAGDGPRRTLEDNPVVDWVRAFALGVRDTAKDMLDAGRKGADEGYAEGWKRFDKKTKYRRKPDPNAPSAPVRRRRDS